MCNVQWRCISYRFILYYLNRKIYFKQCNFRIPQILNLVMSWTWKVKYPLRPTFSNSHILILHDVFFYIQNIWDHATGCHIFKASKKCRIFCWREKMWPIKTIVFYFFFFLVTSLCKTFYHFVLQEYNVGAWVNINHNFIKVVLVLVSILTIYCVKYKV